MKITDEMIEAFGKAAQASVLAQLTEREEYEPKIANRAGLEAAAPLIAAQVLREAYWKLRQHASELRSTEVYRKASERREGTLSGSPAHQRYRWLEATARGIEDGAQDIAEMLGVEESEIDEPDAP